MENSQTQGKEGATSDKVFNKRKVFAAEDRANSLIEQAKFNEAIEIVEQLEVEVNNMVMHDRFSKTAKPSEGVYSSFNGGLNAAILKGLTEDEYKRQILLINLRDIKNKILQAISDLDSVIIDIEATKQE